MYCKYHLVPSQPPRLQLVNPPDNAVKKKELKPLPVIDIAKGPRAFMEEECQSRRDCEGGGDPDINNLGGVQSVIKIHTSRGPEREYLHSQRETEQFTSQ